MICLSAYAADGAAPPAGATPTAAPAGENTTAASAKPAPRQGGAGQEADAEHVRFLSTGWLVFLVLGIFHWLVTMDLVNRDATRLHFHERLWNTAFVCVGVGCFALVFRAHAAFIVLAMASIGGLTAFYVSMRNRRVATDDRVFTQYYFETLARRFLGRFSKRLGETPRQERMSTVIRLMRKDGADLDALSPEGRPTPTRSEASIAVKEVIESAVRARATDIHLEPKQNEMSIRFRVDGILHALPSYPAQLAAPMISAIKVLADMDIAEKRQSQDGTFSGELEKRILDFRVATSPTVHGEHLALRILDRDRDLLNLDRLGMHKAIRQRFEQVISAPHGMLIVAGPTGAGKTTTLYAAIQNLDAFQKNIMTIENPIEYRLDNVTQTAINPKAGVTFATSLRAMLRQDPDIIMVGEIRDAETARTALQAAMTGHFVFTTVHANDSVTALFRLMDLGVEPYLVASSLSGILSQRLVRLLCEHCKQPYPAKPELLARAGIKPAQCPYFYKAVGCETCQGIGYHGRTGIYELLALNDTIRDLIRGNPSIQLLKAEARKAGLITMQESGLAKVCEGVTSLAELVRVTK